MLPGVWNLRNHARYRFLGVSEYVLFIVNEGSQYACQCSVDPWPVCSGRSSRLWRR